MFGSDRGRRPPRQGGLGQYGPILGGRASGPWTAVILVLLLAQLVFPALAGGAPPNDPPVMETMEVRFSSFSHAVLNATLAIHEYPGGGSNVPADTLRERLIAPGQDAFRAEVENYTTMLFCQTVSGVVPAGTFDIGPCRFDPQSLSDVAGTDEYHPPVVLTASGEFTLGPAAIGLPAGCDIDRLAPLLLMDGAWLQRALNITAGPGCDIVLQLDMFPGAVFASGHSGRQALVLDNSRGSSDLSREFSITILSPSATPPGGDSASITGTVDIPDLDDVSICGTMEIASADPAEYWVIPDGVRNVTALSGRTLCSLVTSGLISTGDIYRRGIGPLVDGLAAGFSDLLRVNFTFVPEWNTGGALSCTVRASSSGGEIFALDPGLVRGALNAGAEYRLSLPVELGWPTELELVPPAGMVLKGLGPGGSSSAGRTPATFRNNGSGVLEATLASAHPASLANDVRVEVVADFNRPSPQLARLILEQDTDVPVVVDANVMMGSFPVPGDIRSLLPSNFSLSYISADLWRLLLDKKVIGEQQMNGLLSSLRPKMDSSIRAALGSEVHPSVRFVPASTVGYHLDKMDGARPVVIEAWATGTREKHVDLFKSVRASSGVLGIRQDFALRGVEGASVTYRFRFAPELHLASVEGRGARVLRGEDGGRDFFEVSFGPDGGAANVTARLEPDAGFLASSLGLQLSPCVALFIVIAAVMLMTIRKRRRRRKARLILRQDD